jgi:hypothetical protein
MTSPLPSHTVDDVSGATKIAPFPTPSPSWSQDDPSHPGFLLNGQDKTPGRKAYFILLEAKPGKEDLVMKFLQDINNGVNQEPLTGPWFGLRYSKTTFAIFEAFPSVEGRSAHNVGPGGVNFQRSDLLKDMLAYPASINRMDVLHGKFGVMLGEKITPVVQEKL